MNYPLVCNNTKIYAPLADGGALLYDGPAWHEDRGGGAGCLDCRRCVFWSLPQSCCQNSQAKQEPFCHLIRRNDWWPVYQVGSCALFEERRAVQLSLFETSTD